MSLGPPEWPLVPSARVVWRRASIGADAEDVDQNADWRPSTGKKITLRASISGMLVYDPTGPSPITVEIADVPCIIDDDGNLVTSPGGLPVFVASTDDLLMSVQGWTWFVTEYPKIRFTATTGDTVDLSDYVTAPAVDATKSWVERIPELLAAAEQLNQSIAAAGG